MGTAISISLIHRSLFRNSFHTPIQSTAEHQRHIFKWLIVDQPVQFRPLIHIVSKLKKYNTIAGDKKLKGVLCYQVPENWTELEITVDLGYSSKDEITLLLSKQ